MSELVRAPIGDYRFFIGGNATFTVEPSAEFIAAHPDCRPHYTFKVRHKEANGFYAEKWYVNLLTGPDNQADFTYIGMLDTHDGRVKLTTASKLGEDALPVRIVRRVFACFWKGEQGKIAAAGWKIMHEGRCCRCGRALTVPSSVEAGIGPECAKMD